MDTKRKRNHSNASDYDQTHEIEVDQQIRILEERLQEFLNPLESKLITIQRVLVWENVTISAIFFMITNVVFWLATRMRIYRLIGIVGGSSIFIDMWVKRIWPEIRVPTPPGEDEEEWTQVHPKLLSVPELSQILAKCWILISRTCHWFCELRNRSHFKFFLLSMVIFITLAYIGTQISDFYLLYTFVMISWTLPASCYHELPQKLHAVLEPHIRHLEHIFNVRRKRSKKGKKRSKQSNQKLGIVDSDSDSDEGVQEFCPEPTASGTYLLSRVAAQTPRKGTGDSPRFLSPEDAGLGSRDHSDLEYATDEDVSFTHGLKSMPGVEDSQLDDHSDDQGMSHLALPRNRSALSINQSDHSEDEHDITFTEKDTSSGQSGMNFVATHFKESSDSDDKDTQDVDESIASGLSFPDMHEIEASDEAEASATRDSLLGQMSSAVSSQIMKNTMGALMSSTVSGLTNLSQTMAQVTASRYDDMQETKAHSTGSTELEEFEFLEQYDLEVENDMKEKDN